MVHADAYVAGFIYAYTLLNEQSPAEADFQRFFGVTTPTVHDMILALERRGFISRVPRQSRSIKLMIPATDLPQLQPIEIIVARY